MSTAFIGLGNMGLPMASNLNQKHKLICFDLMPAARTAAKKAKLTVAADALAAVREANTIITMLPAGIHVRNLYCGDNSNGGKGILQHLRRNTLLIDCSTTAPQDARAMAALANKSGMRFVDAPVSGGIGGARAATLSFLVGGVAADVKRARPILAAMGANIFHAGAVGDGQAAKICNNMMLSIQMAGASEALALSRKMGLDAKTISNIMRASSGGNWVVEKYNPIPGVMPAMPASNGYHGGFMVDLMVKDSDLALDAAKNCNAVVPMAAQANQLFRLHQSHGHGQLDFSSIITMFDEKAAKHIKHAKVAKKAKTARKKS